MPQQLTWKRKWISIIMDLYYILAAISTTCNQVEAEQASLDKFPIAITTVTAASIILIRWQIFTQCQICIARGRGEEK